MECGHAAELAHCQPQRGELLSMWPSWWDGTDGSKVLFILFFLTTATSPWQHSPHFHAYSVFPVCAIPACHISPIPIYNTTMHAQKVRLSELRARIHTRNRWSHRSAEWLPAPVINNALRNCKLSKALKVLFVHEQGITVRYATTSAKSLKTKNAQTLHDIAEDLFFIFLRFVGILSVKLRCSSVEEHKRIKAAEL